VQENRLFFKNVLQLFSSSIFAHIVSFVFSFLLARLYSPTYWADFTLFSTVSHVCGIVVTGKYEFALFIPRDIKKRNLLFMLSTFVSIFSAFILLLIATVLFLIGYNPFINYGIYILFVFPVLAGLVGIQNSFFAWYNSNQQYGRMFYPRFYRSSFVNSSQSVLGVLGCRINGLWMGFIAGHVMSTVYFYSTNFKALWEIFKYKNKRLYLIALMKQYQNYPKFFLPSEVLDFLSSQLPILLFAYFFEESVLGQYGFAFRFVILPLILIAASVNKVFLERSAQQSLKSAGELAFEICKRTSLLIVVPFCILFFSADMLFDLFFGEKWVPAGEFIQILSPWLAMMFIAVPISSFFAAKEKQKQSMLANSVLLSVRFLALWIGCYFFHNPKIALVLYSTVGFFYWVGICVYIFKKTDFPLLKVFWYFLKVFGSVFTVFFIAYTILCENSCIIDFAQ